MNNPNLNDAIIDAIRAIDAGDIDILKEIIFKNPFLLSERFINSNERYFKDPYLLYFIAYNPVRDGQMSDNIVNGKSVF